MGRGRDSCRGKAGGWRGARTKSYASIHMPTEQASIMKKWRTNHFNAALRQAGRWLNPHKHAHEQQQVIVIKQKGAVWEHKKRFIFQRDSSKSNKSVIEKTPVSWTICSQS